MKFIKGDEVRLAVELLGLAFEVVVLMVGLLCGIRRLRQLDGALLLEKEDFLLKRVELRKLGALLDLREGSLEVPLLVGSWASLARAEGIVEHTGVKIIEEGLPFLWLEKEVACLRGDVVVLLDGGDEVF